MERRFPRIQNRQYWKRRRLYFERIVRTLFLSTPTFGRRQLLHDLLLQRRRVCRQNAQIAIVDNVCDKDVCRRIIFGVLVLLNRNAQKNIL